MLIFAVLINALWSEIKLLYEQNTPDCYDDEDKMCTQPYSCIEGICIINATTGSSFCDCIPGWENDNSFFHLPNCSIPNYGLLAIFLVKVVLLIPIIVAFIRAIKISKRRKAKWLAFMACVSATISISHGLALYLENGMFEATSLLYGLDLSGINYLGENITLINLAPIMVLSRKSIESASRKVKMLTWLCRSLFILSGILLASFCRTTSYNAFAIANLGIIIFVGISSNTLQFLYCQRLIQMIDDVTKAALIQGNVSSNEQDKDVVPKSSGSALGLQKQDEIKHIRSRLVKSRNGTVAHILPLGSVLILIISIFFGLGNQFPFAWCLISMFIFSHSSKYYSLYVLVHSQKIPETTSNNQITLTQNKPQAQQNENQQQLIPAVSNDKVSAQS